MLCLHVESTFHSVTFTEIIIFYLFIKMNFQRDSTDGQTSRSLVEDTRVQSSTDDVGPSTGQEERRDGAASPGTSGSSGAEMQKKLKAVKLSGNEHLSLVDAEDESKVICHIFPFSNGPVCSDPGRKGWDRGLRTSR